MKISFGKINDEVRMSIEPENEAELHQVNHIRGMMEANGIYPVKWTLEGGDRGITISIKTPTN